MAAQTGLTQSEVCSVLVRIHSSPEHFNHLRLIMSYRKNIQDLNRVSLTAAFLGLTMKPVLGSLLSWPVGQLVTWTWRAKRSQTSHHLCLSSLKITSLLYRGPAQDHADKDSSNFPSHSIFPSWVSFFLWQTFTCFPPLFSFSGFDQCSYSILWSYIDSHFCSPSECALSLMKVLDHWLFLQTVNTSLCSFVLRFSYQGLIAIPPPLSAVHVITPEPC